MKKYDANICFWLHGLLLTEFNYNFSIAHSILTGFQKACGNHFSMYTEKGNLVFIDAIRSVGEINTLGFPETQGLFGTPKRPLCFGPLGSGHS